MNILVISQTGDFLGVAQRLVYEGHRVAMWIKSKNYERSGRGIVERPASWREKLKWSDLTIVDMVGMGWIEPVLRAVGKPFIGCSVEMDRIELDRAAGMGLFRAFGVETPETWSFSSPDEVRGHFVGIDWRDGFVIKADDNLGCATSRVLREPEQFEWAIRQYPANASLIVQRVVKGIEVSTEGWFNGREFVEPFNHTFEEKRFLAGDLGPNTGCMGNVVVARKSNRLTRNTVERVAPFLRKVGWRGPMDINCIVDQKGAYALEATARFGYDAIEALLEGVQLSTGDFFREAAAGQLSNLEFPEPFSIAVRLSVPPYPLEDAGVKAEWGEPILGINEQNINHLWLCDVMVEDNLFRTSGADGLTLVATARGESVDRARRRVYRTLDNLRVGSKMYRRDIGARVDDDLRQLTEWGWL